MMDDIDKYKYFRYRVGFDGCGFYSQPSGANGRNVIILIREKIL